ncbi:antitoxin MazE [Desulfofundulus luciae]|uniref:Antitoxin MazE n=1 Tax=Desulfofundulus luciae TaxID=74702 RepID=A0ABU0B2X9_9FIRM|nr:AbrB/MazE/SpoVT family DNA-binding domain-containing protein [Desulfofundulus luciae]MDQ0286627.1 antitoxin MazE [Desulfofundulus luciae]
MQSRVTKWGNSLGIRIPRTLAEKIGLREGTPVDFEIKDNAIIIRRKRCSLDMLLSQVTPQNVHHEISTGHPVGREIW